MRWYLWVAFGLILGLSSCEEDCVDCTLHTENYLQVKFHSSINEDTSVAVWQAIRLEDSVELVVDDTVSGFQLPLYLDNCSTVWIKYGHDSTLLDSITVTYKNQAFVTVDHKIELKAQNLKMTNSNERYELNDCDTSCYSDEYTLAITF